MDNLPFNSSRLNLIKRKNYQSSLKVRINAGKEIEKQIKEFLKAGGKIQYIQSGIINHEPDI
jgi:hypothetical protein